MDDDRFTITVKRIYDGATANDGFRVLVDRLRPRGMSKEAAQLDLWLGDIAPSPCSTLPKSLSTTTPSPLNNIYKGHKINIACHQNSAKLSRSL
jgi:hypothetical protein